MCSFSWRKYTKISNDTREEIFGRGGAGRHAEAAHAREIARAAGASFATRAGTLEEVRALDFAGVRRLGVTAGASTPEDLLQGIATWCRGNMV